MHSACHRPTTNWAGVFTLWTSRAPAPEVAAPTSVASHGWLVTHLARVGQAARVNPRDNPYTPGAGTAPLVLVGRDEYVTEVSIGLDRLRRGLSARPTLFTGWRGMGKTVLLDRLSEVARGAGWVPVSAEVAKGVEFGPRMAQLVRKALLQAAPPSKWKESSARAARTLRSFNIKLEPDGSLTAGLGVDPLAGSADSGILTDDLVDLFEALGEALLEHGSGVVFILDELHALTEESLGALATALHAVNRRQLPVTLIGAGLPQVRRQLAEAQSYSERLFSFHDVGLLPDVAAGAVLADPSDARGLPWEPQAVAAAVDWCAGYPYFLQELGSLVWDRSDGPTVLEGDVTDALPVLLDRLDGCRDGLDACTGQGGERPTSGRSNRRGCREDRQTGFRVAKQPVG